VTNTTKLTLTLNQLNSQDAEIISHLAKFRAGKGSQERSFEIIRLLIAGLRQIPRADFESTNREQTSRSVRQFSMPQEEVALLPQPSFEKTTEVDADSKAPTTSKELLRGSLNDFLQQHASHQQTGTPK
jgi:hypothetical protein